MPIRSKNIQALASAIDGPVVFNNIREIVRLGKREISRDAYDERYGAIYDAFVERVDWNRVLLEARSKCLRTHSDDIYDDADIPCAECLAFAMLLDETFPDLLEAPDARQPL